ncbi:MAG: hypothetical protein P4L85_10230 [Paludisphaera borealis]|uniref:hypothetical protein n=1 Tax=Paludisphaera borealis TaxID=1387353 RepID=UPI00284A8756|nr:hypothetical protein [Paludisphaera borealis]MDR3619716.1 hypothetical protein [Paludisphaera borealis]
MTDNAKNSFPRSRPLGLLAGTLVVMAAGAASLDENRARFLQASAVARRDLAESLRRFDQDFRVEQQQAVRSIDDRLKTLPTEEREHYLAAMRRFHNWVEGLPERVRDDLLAKAPDQRLGSVKTLVAKYPLPDVEARSPVDFIQTGGTGAFEVASLCKTWLALSPQERQKLDGSPAGSRRAELRRLGHNRNIPAELTPPDYNEKHWIDQAENRLNEIRGSGTVQKDWITKLENRIAQTSANRKGDGKESPRPFLHRLAVNLYVQEHTPPAKVDSGRLAQFFASIPSWVQSTFNVFPSDEARRRLTLVYRLVYPHPQEFDPRAGAGAKAQASPSPAASKTEQPRPPAPPAQPKNATSKPSNPVQSPF